MNEGIFSLGKRFSGYEDERAGLAAGWNVQMTGVMASRCSKRDVLDGDRQRFVDGDRVQYGGVYRPVARRLLSARTLFTIAFCTYFTVSDFFSFYFLTTTDCSFGTWH